MGKSSGCIVCKGDNSSLGFIETVHQLKYTRLGEITILWNVWNFNILLIDAALPEFIINSKNCSIDINDI